MGCARITLIPLPLGAQQLATERNDIASKRQAEGQRRLRILSRRILFGNLRQENLDR